MNDLDRLRAAANLLDTRADDLVGLGSPDEAVLRAVSILLGSVVDDIGYDDHIAWRSTQTAALALADTILGGTDE